MDMRKVEVQFQRMFSQPCPSNLPLKLWQKCCSDENTYHLSRSWRAFARSRPFLSPTLHLETLGIGRYARANGTYAGSRHTKPRQAERDGEETRRRKAEYTGLERTNIKCDEHVRITSLSNLHCLSVSSNIKHLCRGPISKIASMIPGLPQDLLQGSDEEGSMRMKRMIYITDSMTASELDSDGSPFMELAKDGKPVGLTWRVTRVARGSGTSVREVEELLCQYRMMANMAKQAGGKNGW